MQGMPRVDRSKFMIGCMCTGKLEFLLNRSRSIVCGSALLNSKCYFVVMVKCKMKLLGGYVRNDDVSQQLAFVGCS